VKKLSKYWLCITTEEHWNVIRDKRIWAVVEKDRKKLDRVVIGDFLVFYVKQRVIDDETLTPQIRGIFKVNSKPYTDSTRVFVSPPSKEIFTYRVKIHPIIVPNEAVDFKVIIPKLRFIKNKKKWFLYLQIAMRTIPEEDYNLLMTALKNSR
jgi:predicted RNA-binding protein